MRSSHRGDIRQRRLLTAAVAAGMAAGIAVGGCAAGMPADPAAHPITSVAAASPLVLDEWDNGHTIQARLGQSIELDLHSSYWQALHSTAPEVVQQQGRTVASPGDCPPGVGCGTFRSTFVVQRAGTARLVADRISCGEARLCAPDQRRFDVTILVAG
jgi:hypothetical protein